MDLTEASQPLRVCHSNAKTHDQVQLSKKLMRTLVSVNFGFILDSLCLE